MYGWRKIVFMVDFWEEKGLKPLVTLTEDMNERAVLYYK